MKRFNIDAFNDGHVAVTTLTRIEGGGSAAERRAKRRNPEPESEWTWRRDDRKILRHGVIEPVQIAEGVELLPFGSEDMVDSAMENDAFAEAYVDFAAATMQEIIDHNSNFSVERPRKAKKVVLIYEGETTEEL